MILVDFLVLSLLSAPKPAEPSIYARFPNWLSPPLYKAIDCMIVYVITMILSKDFNHMFFDSRTRATK